MICTNHDLPICFIASTIIKVQATIVDTIEQIQETIKPEAFDRFINELKKIDMLRITIKVKTHKSKNFTYFNLIHLHYNNHIFYLD